MNPHRRSLFTSLIRAWLNSTSFGRTTLMFCLLASATNVKAQSWSATGSLVTGRYFHTATLLGNGKVLVMGGTGVANPYLTIATAELYDPATGQWSETGSLRTPRYFHVAVRLANGKVLVTGGFSVVGVGAYLNSAEIYDPDSGTWSAARNLLGGHAAGDTATLLNDGRVLVAGGFDAELYDPATDVWSPAGAMNSPRSQHTATLLPDGRVLVVGGDNPMRSAELYNPGTGSWTATGDLITPRVVHTATLLHNGKVLVAGGGRDDYPYNHGDGIDKAELYDPATGQWSATGSLMAPRAVLTTTLLPNGKALAVGGFDAGKDANSAEIYDPDTGSWSVTGSLNTARSFHTASPLSNGKVLVVGGSAPFGSLGSAELYDLGFEAPLLTLNSTSYCIGVPWSLMVIHSAHEASVRLLGVSNGLAWEIFRWGATDQDGSFRASGSMADGAEGTHTLIVEISGIRSSPFTFAVSKCKP